MTPAFVLDITAGQFQAAWYYSLVAATLLAVTVYGGGTALRAAFRVWSAGDPPAATMIAVAAMTGVLIFVGFLAAAGFGLHIMFQHS